MTFLSDMGGNLQTLGFYGLSFVFVLTLIVFVHEYGHYRVARWCGVGVKTFSIAFGREIFGWTDARGTRWKLGWLPLGGYVKFEGDLNGASMPSTPELEAEGALSDSNFHGKPVWQRAAVVAAGPIANFLLAIVIFAGLFLAVGYPVGSTRIEAVMPDGAAAAAGVQPGDIVVSVAGQEVVGFPDIQRIVMARSGEPLELVLDRNGEALKLEVTPRAGEIDDGFGGKVKVGLIGIQSAAGASSFERKGPLEALALGVGETWDIVSGTFHFLGRMVNGRESAEHLGGPLAIAQISGRAASMGFFELMRLAAAISVSIGLINLFPIPMLDGGHLVYYAIEAARGRPLGAQAQEIGFKIGFALVLAMMVFSTWNDLLRLVRF